MSRYAGIKFNDCVDGEGICVSFWTQGCPFHCPNCHNPETWDFEGGYEYTKEVEESIIAGIRANGIQRNFSVLGGEPFSAQSKDLVYTLISKIRENFPTIKIYVWTGFLYEQLTTDKLSKAILEKSDVLIDGPYIDSQRDLTLKLRGSRNQRVIDLKRSLQEDSIITIDS